MIAGGYGSVRVWWPAGGTPLAHPLDLPALSWVVALRCNIIVTAGGREIGIHQPGLLDPYEIAFYSAALADRHDHSDNGRLSGTTQAPASDHAGGGPPPGARLGHVIRYIC